MTAFARSEQTMDSGRLAWELRTVNHRYLDLHPRLPEELRFLEPALRERVSARIARGKVDAVLTYRATSSAPDGVEVDWSYADQLIAACEGLAARQSSPAPVSPLELLRLPGVLKDRRSDLEPVARVALTLLDGALDELVAARVREGERLWELLRERLDALRARVVTVRTRRQTLNAGIRERLVTRIEALGVDPEPGRLEQELAYIAQRLDVDEELARLDAHSDEIADTLAGEGPMGRRLDFLMQELNREANTLASKSADAETTAAAVDMKVLVEQMREQVQNVE